MSSGSSRSAIDVLTVDLGGHPYRFDGAACLRFVALLKAGNYPTPAAESCGLSPGAMRRWRARGETILRRGKFPVWAGGILPTRPALERFCRVLACIADPRKDPELWLAGFAAACIEAEAEAEAAMVLTWRKAATERPELAVKFLERRYADRWGAKPAPAVQVTTGNVGALTIYAPPEEEP